VRGETDYPSTDGDRRWSLPSVLLAADLDGREIGDCLQGNGAHKLLPAEVRTAASRTWLRGEVTNRPDRRAPTRAGQEIGDCIPFG
jgi:hypothetical protein